MNNQINFSPITQFAQQVRSAEFTHQKEIKLSIQQARLLNLALVEIMDLLLNQYKQSAESNDSKSEVIQINMDGGGFN